MKVQVASDLHLEFMERRFPAYRAVERTAADVLVLAGDIHRQAHAIAAFQDWPIPVLLIHGNHELYHSVAEETLDALRREGGRGNVRFLERESLVVNGTRFLACCLWTDYALYDAPEEAMRNAQATLADHRLIRTGGRLFDPEDALRLHEQSRKWLETELARRFDGPTVVCTHHAPHPGSIHATYEGDPLNPCFISDLTELMERVDVWVHGHVHNSFDYRVGRTRVLANPRGYPLDLRQANDVAAIVWENPNFDARKVVEV